MKKILLVVGARPNFIKAAPLFKELENHEGISPLILHTGQHYDYEMSRVFFEDFDLPNPHFHLDVGAGSHAVQTAGVMVKTEEILLWDPPDLVVVFGDVNSTLAAALSAKKLHIPVAHVEAGLRSFDKTMPEEINRKVTDAISDLLFTHCRDAEENLQNEGIPQEKIFPVGNIMIDSLRRVVESIDRRLEEEILSRHSLQKKRYILVTLHRPRNVDSVQRLGTIIAQLRKAGEHMPCVMPLHPRTRGRMEDWGLLENTGRNIMFTGPKSYKEFIGLEKNATIVITDSGGIQEESTYLGVPCLTVRPNTERPVTVTMGTNTLVEPEEILDEIKQLANERNPVDSQPPSKIPPMWDGLTAKRIGEYILDHT